MVSAGDCVANIENVSVNNSFVVLLSVIYNKLCVLSKRDLEPFDPVYRN